MLKRNYLNKYIVFDVYHRLRRINEEISVQQMPRRRSNSLPIPKIEVSIYQSPESKKKDVMKDFIEVPDTRDASLTAGTYSWSFSLYQDKILFFFCVDFVTFSELYMKPTKVNRDIPDVPAKRRKSEWRWPISRPL